MPDSARDHRGDREVRPEVGHEVGHAASSLAASSSGFTRFLVDGASSASISRETLVEAVRSLLRERDYLRTSRDMALADFKLEAITQKEHAEELEKLLQRETEASRQQADALGRDRAALENEVAKLLRERSEILADREAVRTDRDEILADRDAWRARATRSLAERVRRTLPGLAGRWFRSSGNTREER